jgi:chorismate lyase / 3-hydroxybenzoate synthase
LHTEDSPDTSQTAAATGPADAVPLAPRIRVEYRALDAHAPLPRDVLAAVRFGKFMPSTGNDALVIDVALRPLPDPAPAELWFANGPVHTGRLGHVRYAHDDHFLFAAIELSEDAHGGILTTAELAYREVRRIERQLDFRHVLRMWNYFDAINSGDGDLERYRQFCVGRARGIGAGFHERYPAATAIGRQEPTGTLQVFWLADRNRGSALENPRQVSAYHYPRAHGPVSPGFSRATIARDGTVLISGTASIVGHASRHHDDPLEQLEETLRNLTALDAHAGPRQCSRNLLRVYVRDPALAASIATRLNSVYPPEDIILLAADVCRRELAVEIECLRCA